MDINQMLPYLAGALLVGVIGGIILCNLFHSLFDKKNDFKVAKLEELPEGEYAVYCIMPVNRNSNFQFQKILLIKTLKNGKEVGNFISTFLTYDLITHSKERGELLSFSLFYGKNDCVIRLNFKHSAKFVTLRKNLTPSRAGYSWEIASQSSS